MIDQMQDMLKRAVQARHPDAVSEPHYTQWGNEPGYYSVWDIPVSMTHGVRHPGEVARGRALLGLGTTERRAWADAVQNLPKYC